MTNFSLKDNIRANGRKITDKINNLSIIFFSVSLPKIKFTKTKKTNMVIMAYLINKNDDFKSFFIEFKNRVPFAIFEKIYALQALFKNCWIYVFPSARFGLFVLAREPSGCSGVFIGKIRIQHPSLIVFLVKKQNHRINCG
jgi:hypothetical protein